MRLSNTDKSCVDNLYGKAGGGRDSFSRCLFFIILLIFCIFELNIHKIYGFCAYPDEFGYWASAAAWIGYDWSQTASIGYYYSFGYSLLLMPVLKFFKDSVAAYRAAVTLNMLLQCAASALLLGIFRIWYSGKRWSLQEIPKVKNRILLAAGCAVFYPAWTFYVQMTLTEALLTFLYVLICFQLLLFLKKPKMSGAVFLALSFLYLYFVHMRTVGVAAAGILTLSAFAWKKPSSRKPLLAGMIVFILGLAGGLWLKSWVTDNVYAAADAAMLAVNDYAGQFGKIKSLFTLQGIRKLFLSCAGKLYYLGIASFGLLYPAVYGCLRESAKLFAGVREKHENCPEPERTMAEEKGYFSLFALLSLCGQFLVTAVGAMEPGRLDGIVYGRYNEYLLPLLLGIGLLTFCDLRHKLREFLLSVVCSAVLFGITYLNTLHSGLTAMQGYFCTGLSYLADDWHYDIRSDPVKAFLLEILLMVFVRGCAYAGSHMKKNASGLSVMGVVFAVEILLAVCLQKKYTWLFNDVDYYNLQIYEYIQAHGSEEDQVSYLYGGGLPYIDLIQFAMRERQVEIITMPDTGDAGTLERILPEEGFLIVDYGCPYLEALEEIYVRCEESKAFVLLRAEGTEEALQ